MIFFTARSVITQNNLSPNTNVMSTHDISSDKASQHACLVLVTPLNVSIKNPVTCLICCLTFNSKDPTWKNEKGFGNT